MRSLDATAESLARAEAARSLARDFKEASLAAPELLNEIRRELDASADAVRVVPPADGTLVSYERSLAQATADLRSARESMRSIEDEATRRLERRATIPDEIADRTRRLDALAERAPPNGTGVLAEVRSREQAAAELALTTEREALAAELESYEARNELLPARRDRAARRVTRAEQVEEAWRGIVEAAQRREADSAARAASRLRREAASKSGELSSYAEVSEALAEARAGDDGLPRRIARVREDLAETRERLTALSSLYDAAMRRLETSGMNRATGIVLRSHYGKLEDTGKLRAQLKETRNELENAEVMLVDRQESRLGASDVDSTVARLTAAAAAEGVDVETPEFRTVVREVATARRDLLNQRMADAQAYFEELASLEAYEARLLDATSRYRDFIGERILWVKSIPRKGAVDEREGLKASESPLDPDIVGNAAAAVWSTVTRYPARSLVYAGTLVASTGLAFVCLRATRRIAKLVRGFRTDRLALTYAGMGLTLTGCLPVPVAWWSVTRILASAGPEEPLVSLAWAADRLLVVVFSLSLLHAVISRDGLAEAHFRWPPRATRALRRNLLWFGPLFVFAMLPVLALEHGPFVSVNASIGRWMFTASQIVFGVFASVALRPRGAVFADYLAKRASPLARSAMPWLYAIAILLPALLVALSSLGYHYTSLELSQRIASSLGLIMALVLVNAMLMRWLFVARRRVAIEDAKRRREQALAEATEETGEAMPTESSVPPLDVEKLDLPAISAQTTQLFRAFLSVALAVGLLGVWSDVLPALRGLEQVEIWPEARIVEGKVDPGIAALIDPGSTMLGSTPTTDPAANHATTSEPARPNAESSASDGTDGFVVTLADVLLAVALGIVFTVAFRNIPGLAEIFILQRLPLDPASRFALSTVLRYAIGITGILATAAALNFQWERVQWLAAALTFGLGFGLQEIFANFVSGLIILAERPIRIGDTVTVGSVSGTVSKIRMRATTVTDWDRKELVIPNRKFITDEVINWTLSDPMLRIIVPIGVAYGSDVGLVERVLMRVGEQNALVLDDPKHYVLFRDFGDSTLNFELRVFIPNIDGILVVQHQLRVAIDAAFREHGIEIAFPQRDLHIRSADPLVAIAEGMRRGERGEAR